MFRCKTELGNLPAVIGAMQRIKKFGRREIGESVTKKRISRSKRKSEFFPLVC